MVSIDHLNLTVSDLEQSIAWYDNVFNFKPVERGLHKDCPFAILRNNESMLCLYEFKDAPTPETNHAHKVYHFGLRVTDKEAWEAHLEKQKIQPHLIWDYPNSKSWYIKDPTGHEIEVSHWNNNEIKF